MTVSSKHSESASYGSQRVRVNTLRASMSNSLRLTSVCDETDASTASIDSFIPAIDFSQETEESYDPYLQPHAARRRKRFQERLQSLRGRASNSKAELDFFCEKATDRDTPTTVPEDSFPDTTECSFFDQADEDNTEQTPDYPKTLRVPVKSDFHAVVATEDLSIPTSSFSASEANNSYEQEYWSRMVDHRTQTQGWSRLTTADALMELGSANLARGDVMAAQQSFHSAYRIFQEHQKPLSAALAMEKMGIANMDVHNKASLKRAYTLLLEAFRVRQSILGSFHVDTVDCLNVIARVHSLANDLEEAQRCYWQVFWVRKAVFGGEHPSCAVAAHDLANVFYRQGEIGDADNFYSIALEIYDKMDLPDENPAVQKLLVDRHRLERVQMVHH